MKLIAKAIAATALHQNALRLSYRRHTHNNSSVAASAGILYHHCHYLAYINQLPGNSIVNACIMYAVYTRRLFKQNISVTKTIRAIQITLTKIPAV